MLLKYTARDKEGKLITGEIEIDSKESLANKLKNEGLLLTSTESVENADFKQKLNASIQKLKRIGTVPLEEKLFFTQNLQIMLHAGISLSQAMATLVEQTKNERFKYILKDIQQNIEKGISFAASLEKHKKIFTELYINMIKTGETSGQLENTLEQLRIQLKKDHDLISKIKGAMAYPVIVIIAMVGVIITVITFVIPKLTDLFEGADVELPLPTRVLIFVSNFTIHYGIYLFFAFIILAFLTYKFIKTENGKKIWHKFLLVTPILGPIIKKINLARFSRTISSLLKTEIPIVESFQITSKTLGNYYYRETMKNASELLKKGVSVTEALKGNVKLFPPIVTQMISVGEQSGSLDSILENLAVFYEEEVTDVMNNLSSIIEPVLILLLGLGVGAIAVSVIMPMYSLTQAI